MRYYLATLFATFAFAVPWFAYEYPHEFSKAVDVLKSTGSQLAAVIIHKPKTVAELQTKYRAVPTTKAAEKVKVLLVPGHEPGFGGTSFGGTIERELVVELADHLTTFLKGNPHYEVYVTRTNKEWNPAFADYFKNSWNDIVEWRKAHRAQSPTVVSVAQKNGAPKVYHNKAPDNVAMRLHGITKWANENDIDIVLHIHLNDYPRKRSDLPGTYTGLSIYVPQEQFNNSTTTRVIAEALFNRLSKYNPISDLPGESVGIVEEDELIAIGVDNSADAASMLIEYGYIYEPQFTNPDVRSLALKELAYQTYIGLEDFFSQGGSVKSERADTLLVPYYWSNKTETDLRPADIYAIQTALILDGVYPPGKKTKNDCPRSGRIGPCTKEAIGDFQKKYNIPATQIVGEKTVEQLNKLYSGII